MNCQFTNDKRSRNPLQVPGKETMQQTGTLEGLLERLGILVPFEV
jgi:hypothetical protein